MAAKRYFQMQVWPEDKPDEKLVLTFTNDEKMWMTHQALKRRGFETTYHEREGYVIQHSVTDAINTAVMWAR